MYIRSNLKRVSPDEPLPDDDDPRTPQERATAILDELMVLKQSELDTSFNYATNGTSIAVETLKDVFSESVDTILDEHSNNDALREVFEDFNFDLVRIHPSAMMAVICRPGLLGVAEQFRTYLLQQENLTSREVDLILRFLAFEEFSNRGLLQKLKQEHHMKVIIEIFERARVTPRHTGYFDITNGRMKKLLKMDSVIHQIRLRHMAQKRHSYSEALNFLLNEIHGICYEIHRKQDASMRKAIKNYNVNDVEEFLQAKNVPTDVIIQIRNLFDRRNISTMSHPGSSDHPAVDVTYDDYSHFHLYVGKCLSIVLK